MAKKSDASMAKFSQKLDNEDKVTRGLAKKRKVAQNLDFSSSLDSVLFFLLKKSSNCLV
jgi:hypothetical protein